MADPTSPTGNALQLPGAAAHPVGAPLVSVCGAAADSIPSLGFAQDGHQRPTGGPLPLGTDAYSPVSPGFVMMPQRPTQQPVAGMELPQMVKLSDRVSQAPGPMGMVGLSGLPKTPPKSLPARPQPEGGGMTPDSSRAGRADDSQSRLAHTPPTSCGPLVTSPGGLSMRRGCGSAGSSTVSSSASGPGGRCSTQSRSGATAPASRSTLSRRISTPVSRPIPSISGLLGSNAFHTEYREQMSPSWWLGAAACSAAWLQLAPPPEVMELVEKKKLTEQFKTVEGLIDRAVRLELRVYCQHPIPQKDTFQSFVSPFTFTGGVARCQGDYLGALRLQADRRNVLHFLALDEQEMQTYLWQPRYPRIVDLRSRTGNAGARPPPRSVDYFVDLKQLWLRLLTITPPLYSTASPIPTGSGKKPQGIEAPARESASPSVPAAAEPQEYCLGSSGEQFLPILFDDSGGVAECIPPEDLLQFEEDALREVASHIESKLTHALTCMLLASMARANASAASRERRARFVAPTSRVETHSEVCSEGVAEFGSGHGKVKRRRTTADKSLTSDSGGKPQDNSSPAHDVLKAPEDSSPSLGHSTLPKSPAEGWGISLPPIVEPDAEGGGPVISIEDIVTTYGTAPSLMRHKLCFQQDANCR